jgi:hypothetical protein
VQSILQAAYRRVQTKTQLHMHQQITEVRSLQEAHHAEQIQIMLQVLSNQQRVQEMSPQEASRLMEDGQHVN